jgi:hypothetical protein
LVLSGVSAGSMRRVAGDEGPGDEKRWRPRPELSSVDIDGCVSVYSPATERVVTLNETASAIWRLTLDGRNLDEIVATLAERYSVEPAQIRVEVEHTVATFESEGLYADPGNVD